MNDKIGKLRYLYKDVINGYTYFKEKKLYVKHLKEKDLGEVSQRKHEIFEDAKNRGLNDEKEKIQILIDSEAWTEEKEKDVEKLEEEILHLEQSKKKLILGKQIKEFNKKIEKKTKLYDDLASERESEVGFTAEKYVDKRINEEIVNLTFFKNRGLTERFFSEEEFDELTEQELLFYVRLYTVIALQYSNETLKKISVCGFFLNCFLICENNPDLFFGKPVTELTNNQVDIFSYGRYFKGIMTECKPAPYEISDNPDKLIEYYEASRKSRDAKQLKGGGKESEFMGSTVFGATKEELGAVIEEGEESTKFVDFKGQAESSGKDMDLKDFLKMHKK